MATLPDDPVDVSDRSAGPGQAVVGEGAFLGTGGAAAREPSSIGSPHPAATAVAELRMLARTGSLGLVGQVASSLLAFAFSLAVARHFHARGSGVFFEAVALFTIAASLGELGADFGLNRTVPQLRATGRIEDIRRLLRVSLVPVLVFSSILALVLAIVAPDLAPLISHGHSTAKVVFFIRVLSPFLPVASLIPVLVAGTKGFETVWPLVGISNVALPLARLVVLVALVAAGTGLAAVAWAWTTPMALGAVALLWVLVSLARRLRTEVAGSGGLATEGGSPLGVTAWPRLGATFWRFSAPGAISSMFAIIVLWLDVLLVGGILSTRAAGVYALASRYMSIGTYALGAVGAIFASQVSRLFTLGRVGDVRKLYQTSTAWIMALAGPCIVVMVIFALPLMRLFGPQFVSGTTSLVILSFGALCITTTGNNAMLLLMAGRSMTAMWISGVSMAVNITANLLLIPHLGIDGAATAWLLTLIVSNGLTATVLWHRFRLQPVGRAFVLVVVATVGWIGAVGALARASLGSDWRGLALTVVVGGAGYVITLWRTRDALELSSFVSRIRPPVAPSS